MRRSRRSSYEARVLLVPLGPAARTLVDEMERAGLSGMARLEHPSEGNGDGSRYRLVSLGEGWAVGRPEPSSLGGVMDDADVVVFVGTDLSEARTDRLVAVGDAAREAGDLLAAVTVGPPEADDAARRGLAALREQIDMLVNVRSAGLASSFLDVVRGGRREPTIQEDA
jgi:hypothetical protein